MLGATLVDRVIVPENPPKLARVTVEELEELRGMVRVTGFAVIEKSPALLKTAVCTVSGSGVGVPLAMVTQIPPETLVLEQPVWKPRGIPEVRPVML